MELLWKIRTLGIERVGFSIALAAASRNFSSRLFRQNTTSEFSDAVDNGRDQG